MVRLLAQVLLLRDGVAADELSERAPELLPAHVAWPRAAQVISETTKTEHFCRLDVFASSRGNRVQGPT